MRRPTSIGSPSYLLRIVLGSPWLCSQTNFSPPLEKIDHRLLALGSPLMKFFKVFYVPSSLNDLEYLFSKISSILQYYIERDLEKK